MSVEVTAAPAPAASSAISTSTPARHIPSLDGIRAGSFLLVFAAHAGLGHLLPTELDLIQGDFGVTIFFFLSGFLITTLLRSELEKHGSVNIRHFWLRRALRILPPLFVVVSAAALATLMLYPAGTLRGSAIAADLLFYGNYWGLFSFHQGEPPGIGVVWSLAVEEHFYLLFPLLYIAMQKWRMAPRSQALLLWGLCAVVLVWRCMLVLGMHAPTARIYVATDTRVDSILFGCALAVWNNPVLDKPTQPSKLWKYVLLPLSLAILLACLVYRNAVFLNTWCFSLQGAALT
ncbi:MAG: acyltransferase, partial [Sinobacteraceae bacterium]|nr:acyltransferase [Nevskiaceae bacterium]